MPPDKVAVIYSGVDPRFRPHSPDEIAAAKDRLKLPKRYVLCVGSLEPRKNLARLLQAWRRIQPRLEGLSLLLVGAQGSVFRDAGFAEPPPGVHLAGYLGDDALPAVYAAAELFVYPSLYEGFGLPIIEAMASGVPVLTSSVTALPEVAGDAAALVDPLDIEAIGAGIERLAADSEARQQLRAKGLAHVAKFSWDQTAAATWHVLEEAA